MKILTILLLLIFCTGCTEKSEFSSEHKKISNYESSALTITDKIIPIETDASNCKSDSNIQFVDLNSPGNSAFLKYYKNFTYGNEYSLSNGKKIVEDKNIYLEDSSGNKTVIIEVAKEDTQKYAVIWDVIDNHRFVYYIINHETIDGSGIYNLETGEDFRIDVCDDGSAYVPQRLVEDYLYFSKGFISDFRGIGKLNIDNYEFTEIDCSSLLDNDTHYLESLDFSPDGTNAAIYGIVSNDSEANELNEYQIVLYSLVKEEVTATYRFFSEYNYVNYQLVYHEDSEIYLYLSQYGDKPQNHLYIINLEN